MKLDPTAVTAITGMQEAHSAKLWDKVALLGDEWLVARGELPVPAALLYAESLMVLGRLSEAILWAQKADSSLVRSDGMLKVAALTTLSRALSRAGDFANSRSLLVEATRVPCADAETQEKQGHILLSISQKWRRGWRLHEARLAEDDSKMPATIHFWDGVTPGPVAVLHEQGIGDAVLAARWIPLLAQKTGHPVTWYGPPLLTRWMQDVEGCVIGDIHAQVASGHEQQGIRLMSLPFVLRCDSPKEVPPPVAPAALRTAREAFRTEDSVFRVGVNWKGSAQGWYDYERSYKAEAFAPLWAPLAGVEFVNLCHREDVPHSAPFARRTFSDVYESGEVASRCHCVVTVDTAMAHIAGSLGIPTLCLVPTVADWRYFWPYGDSTPFYDSITVLRRPTAASTAMVDKARQLIELFSSQVGSRNLA